MAGGTKEVATSAVSAQAQQEAVSEGIETFELPRSIITKLARAAMSENTKMSKDVVLSFQKASTVFINYLAATAHEVAASKQHKSISASDVLKALELVEMGDMVPRLQQELQVYRDIQKSDKGQEPEAEVNGGLHGDEDEEMAEDEEGVEEEAEEEMEDDEADDEDPDDSMAVDDEEVQRDARGLDDTDDGE
ncbi:histone-fold-containing protein [Fomitopsis serialis]|uniref:histone-fold-containing protein n=1 Tax=Fomitopsis serialis TaxID=139415 RepID=UPI002008E6D6|nr:histone-fold-containing protein [Neoantrodia serialis]KAH9920608.1 histone-fold-containing protein [Neoantrodia serialis]